MMFLLIEIFVTDKHASNKMSSSTSDDTDSSSSESEEESIPQKCAIKKGKAPKPKAKTPKSRSSSSQTSSSSEDESELEDESNKFEKNESDKIEEDESELFEGNESDKDEDKSDKLEEFSDVENNSSRSRPRMVKAKFKTMANISKSSSALPPRSSSSSRRSPSALPPRSSSRSPSPSVSPQRKKSRTEPAEKDETCKTFDYTWAGPVRGTKNEVWKHWGFKKFPLKPVDHSVVFCKICGHNVKYKGTSTNMRAHLQSRHQNLGKKVETNQPKASLYFDEESKKKQKYPNKHPINKRARAALVKWFCKRDRPFAMVEDPEFKEFCEILDPNFELPGRTTLTKDVEETFKSEKEHFMEKLEYVPHLFGTNDGATAMNSESFVCNTVHFVDPDTWKLQHETLGCKVMKEKHTAKNYRDHVDVTENEYGIKGKVLGYTTDNENKMHKAFENDQRNGCIAHKHKQYTTILR